MQKNFIRNRECALETAIRSAFEQHPGRRYAGWDPEALSVCRYSAPGGIVYKAVMPDLDWSSELEPAFLTLTIGTGPTARLLRDFGPGDFLRLQQLVNNSALTVTAEEMKAAVARYNAVMGMPAWRQAQYRHQQRRARA
jgi:hypothetical protein